MKKIITLFIIAFSCLSASAQGLSPLQGTERSEAIAFLQKSNSLDVPMMMEFKTTRRSPMLKDALEGTGRAAFCFPDKLRWESTSPKSNIFILNGNMVYMGTPEAMTSMDISSNRRFQSIARSLSRLKDSGLLNEEDFDMKIFRTSDIYRVEMVPLRRDLSQMFSNMVILAHGKSGEVFSITLSGVNGDTSVIKVTSSRRGCTIPDSTFKPGL